MPDWKLPTSVAGLRDLSGYDKVLYAHLFTYTSVAKNPSVRLMSLQCGMDMWTVRRSIRNLEKALRFAKMESASFGFPTERVRTVYGPRWGQEEAIDDFIKERTRLWRESWLIPQIEETLAWAKKES